jgi:hypothetical protein
MLKAEEYSSEGTPVISVGEIREGYFLGSDGIRLRVNGKSICPVDMPKVSVLPAKRWQGGHLAEVELRGHDNAFPESRYSFPLSYNPSAHCRAKAIAHILGTLDDKIELNRKTNETLEAMAKALFQSWFVDFDPVRAMAEGRPTGLPAEISDLFSDSLEESELGEIPRGWEIAAIDHIINL